MSAEPPAEQIAMNKRMIERMMECRDTGKGADEFNEDQLPVFAGKAPLGHPRPDLFADGGDPPGQHRRVYRTRVTMGDKPLKDFDLYSLGRAKAEHEKEVIWNFAYNDPTFLAPDGDLAYKMEVTIDVVVVLIGSNEYRKAIARTVIAGTGSAVPSSWQRSLYQSD
jgi:hypothetical protein